jgi:SAM-dependent methyltransferase
MGKTFDTSNIICPHCKSLVKGGGLNKITCLGCSSDFNIEDNKLIIKKLSSDDVSDGLDRIKSVFKKWGKLYNFAIEVISPVLLQLGMKKFIRENINGDTIALNIGSGNSNISDKITNIDIFPYENVNVCCDIENIPIRDDSVDVVINIAVLEHVRNPEKVIGEIHRILKKDGIIFTYFPFIQPFHASPFDYSRRTIEGVKSLHQDFEIQEVKIGAGPTSGFLWVFQEWISILLSFGNKKLHNILYLMIMILTFPLKYLDVILSRFSTSENITSAFIIIAKKR